MKAGEKTMDENDKNQGKAKKTAESVALNYISYRDRSIFEMRSHLEKKDYPLGEIELCLENLIDWGLLDDESFCKKLISHNKDKQRGSIRVRQELREKGIDRELAEICLDQEYSKEEELEIAMNLAEKIIAGEKDQMLDDRLKAKIARRLASKGFPGNLVYTVLSRVKTP